MLKRLFDFTCAALGLLILSPLLVPIAFLIRTMSPGPALFRARRVGRKGRPFELYKFRSMRIDQNPSSPGITPANDARVTPLGYWLRRFKLDEFPQLINVLKGDMSLVGPRPEDPRYVAHYTPQQKAVLNERPGITSAASLIYRNESDILTGSDWEAKYVNSVLPDKLRIELEYIQRRNFVSDLAIILKTLGALVK